MTQQRDIERLLDQWFSDGPDQAPDRVVEIVTDRIERQSQRPVWRLHGRPFPVNAYAKIAVAAAAILIAAVVGYSLLPGQSTGVGGPARSPSPTASPSPTPAPTASPSPTPAPTASPTPTVAPPGAFGGTVSYQSDGAPATMEIDAVENGARVSGTAVSTSPSGTHSVRLACAAKNGDTWAVAGRVEHSTVPGEVAGPWSVVTVKDGPPQQITIWLSADYAGSDCAGFLASFDFAHLGAENFSPVESGRLVPPPNPAP
jgi:hypothetical protein